MFVDELLWRVSLFEERRRRPRILLEQAGLSRVVEYLRTRLVGGVRILTDLMPTAAETAGLPSPRVAIVVPSFQQGSYLPLALEGLARQTYGSLETAVFDNMSTDTSAEVLRLFEGRMTRIVRAPDRGQADALRTGFASTRADVLGWLNADDPIFPETLERVAAVFRDRPDVDVVYGQCAFVSASGQFLGYFHDIQDFSRRDLVNFRNFIPQPSAFFRRSAYEAVGGIDPLLHYTMDWDLWCRMAKAGCRFHRLDEVLAAARIHPDAKTSKGGRDRSMELWRVNRRHAWRGIPLAAVAQVYEQRLKRYARPLAFLPRWAWSTLLGAPRSTTRVLGIAPGGRLTPGPFRVRFPVLSPVRRIEVHSDAHERLHLEPPAGDFVATQAPVGNGTQTWEMESVAFAGEIDLRGTLDDGAEATIRVKWE